MAYIDTKYLGKCETCRHCRGEYKCNTYCDHGEEYSPNLSKIPTADVAPKSEVAAEIFAEIEKNIVKLGSTNLFGGIKWDVLAELKKKYTEGKE